jgi:hypothetical protein
MQISSMHAYTSQTKFFNQRTLKSTYVPKSKRMLVHVYTHTGHIFMDVDTHICSAYLNLVLKHVRIDTWHKVPYHVPTCHAHETINLGQSYKFGGTKFGGESQNDQILTCFLPHVEILLPCYVFVLRIVCRCFGKMCVDAVCVHHALGLGFILFACIHVCGNDELEKCVSRSFYSGKQSHDWLDSRDIAHRMIAMHCLCLPACM